MQSLKIQIQEALEKNVCKDVSELVNCLISLIEIEFQARRKYCARKQPLALLQYINPETNPQTLHSELTIAHHRLSELTYNLSEARYSILRIHEFLSRHTTLTSPSQTDHSDPDWNKEAESIISIIQTLLNK